MNLENSKPAIFMEEKFEGEGLFILHFPESAFLAGEAFKIVKIFGKYFLAPAGDIF